MNKLNKTTKRGSFKVPIYNVWIDVVVCKSIAEERAKYDGLFGPRRVNPGVTAHFSCTQTGSIAAIFLKRSCLKHELIAHEVFHAVLRIMIDKGEKVTVKHDEPAAYLCGFITDCIYKRLAKMGERVK